MRRAEFERQRGAFRRFENSSGAVLAGVAVGLGVAQLVFLRWADANLDRAQRLPIAGSAFIGYIVLVAGLSWWRTRRLAALSPRCPKCQRVLRELSLRVAAAVGRCDQCGGQVIE